MAPNSGVGRSWAKFIIALSSILATHGQITTRQCTVGQGNDALIGQTQLLGNKNISDSIWHDQVPFFRQYGPISRVTAYKAYVYDGLYHEPGELKGFQFWYGPNEQPPIYTWADGDANLMGARKPHIPGDLVLEPTELITKVELQWDIISMRYVKFWTNKGRAWSWGFPNVPGASIAVVAAPTPGAYLAAMRGFEGKPRAVAKKRYLIQVSFVWAIPSCRRAGAAPAPPAELQVSSAEQVRQSSQRLVSNMYQLDPESVALLPEQIEASNIIYEGTTVVYPPADVVVLVYINETTMITAAGRKGVPPPAGWMVYVPGVTPITPQCHTCPKEAPTVVEEKTPKVVPAPPAAAAAAAAKAAQPAAVATPKAAPAEEPTPHEQPVTATTPPLAAAVPTQTAALPAWQPAAAAAAPTAAVQSAAPAAAAVPRPASSPARSRSNPTGRILGWLFG